MAASTLQKINVYDTGAKCFRRGELEMEDGILRGVRYTGDADASLDYAVPGLVDVHTHGRCGHDFVGSTAEEMRFMRREYAKVGTTTVMASMATASPETYLKTIDAIKEAGYDGVHIEGRYLNPLRKGAHSERLLHNLDCAELSMLLERIHPLAAHITAALEMEGGKAFVECALAHGATIGLGHTDATYEQAIEALEWGASSFTHTFNAMSPLHHRKPGCVTASLSTDAYSEFICDGHHIAPPVVRLSWMAKRHDRFVLITDSMMATGCTGGSYSIGALDGVTIKDGVALLPDGTIAGSIINLRDGLMNLVDFAGCTLEEALPAATINPARMVGLDESVGSLEEGKRADVLLLSPDRRTLKAVYAAGEILE